MTKRPDLQQVINYIHQASNIIRSCDEDTSYIPTDTELQLFMHLKSEIYSLYEDLYNVHYIVEERKRNNNIEQVLK